MHAVVVDPSRVVLKLLSKLISQRGNTVTTFVDSASALQAVKKDASIGVLITSLEVQPMSGLELCWEARLAMGARRPLHIIVMSSLSDDHRLSEALDCGADDLIAKPVRALELHAKLRLAGRLATTQMHLIDLAETDPLTGLFNRRAFFERLNAEMRDKPDEAPLSAILFDIDHFKRVNDTYGHDVGDVVLTSISAEAGKRIDLSGRLGGEEFAMVLPGMNEAQAFDLAEEIRQSCASLAFSAEDKAFSVTCSFGISSLTEGDTAERLLKRADQALYDAKAGGRNRICRSPQRPPEEYGAGSVRRPP